MFGGSPIGKGCQLATTPRLSIMVVRVVLMDQAMPKDMEELVV